MKSKKYVRKLDASLLILLALVLIAAAATFWAGGAQRIISGLTQTVHLINTVWLRLLLGFILGGMIQVLIPHGLIAKWLGPASGLKGILVASSVGLFMTGGPYVRLPIIASIHRAGAGIGPVIALMTANVLSIHMLIVWQIPFLGIGIPLARYIACLFIPPIVGLAGTVVYRLLSGSPQAATGKDHNGF